MKTILKIVVGILIAITIVAVGAMFLVGGAVNEVDKEMKKDQAEYSMTSAEFKEAAIGTKYAPFIDKFGQPDPDRTQKMLVDGLKTVTIYYNVEGGELLDMYQFSFDNGVLNSKSKF